MQTASLNLTFDTAISYNPLFRGYNNEPQRTAVRLDNPALIEASNAYGTIGYVRWPAGTPTNAFNWKTGLTDIEFQGQESNEERRYLNDLTAIKTCRGKGGDNIDALIAYTKATGAKAMIVINVFQESPDAVADLAKYLHDNGVPVVYFELGNEVSFYVKNSGNQQPEYITATDYLNRVKDFDTVIKQQYPGAETVVSFSNKQNAAFDNAMFNYPNRYWDAITTHLYRGDGATLPLALQNANTYLRDLEGFIEEYYQTKIPEKPLYMGELGVTLGSVLDNTHYNGLYDAELILRLLPNEYISYLAGYRITNGLFTPANGNIEACQDAYRKRETADVNALGFAPYQTAPSVCLQVLDGAVNSGDECFVPTVEGGASVATDDGEMPALYALAFKAWNGDLHLVVTNKSAEAHTLALAADGAVLDGTIQYAYCSTDNPAQMNNGMADDTAIVAGDAENPVTVQPYSVTRLTLPGYFAGKAPIATELFAPVAVSEASLRLDWQKRPETTGYTVAWYPAGQPEAAQTMDVTEGTTYTVSGLVAGESYGCTVTGYNSYGSAQASGEQTATISAPAAPVIRRAYPEKSRTAIVEWQSVPGATGYKVYYTDGTNSKTADVGNRVGAYLWDVTNGTQWSFAVAAYNGVGESAKSDTLTCTPKDSYPLSPYFLDNTSGTNDSQAMLTWHGTLAETYAKYFDGQADGWSAKTGTWQLVYDDARASYFYQSPLADTAIAVADNVNPPSCLLEGVFELVALNEEKPSRYAGLVARYTNNQNYYRFIYNYTDDAFRLIKVENSTATTLANKTRAQVLADASATSLDVNRLTLFFNLEGSTLQCGVNQVGYIFTVTDNSLATGSIGFTTLNAKVNFDWAIVNRANAASYELYRSAQPHEGFELLATLPSGTTTYTDATVQSPNSYFYHLKALNAAGQSYHYSNTIKKNTT